MMCLKYGNRLAAFGRNDRGTVAIITALCATILFGIGAFAIDYARGVRARIAMQSILDEAALAAVRVMADNTADPTETANAYFAYNWSRLSFSPPPTISIAAATDRDGVKTVVARAVGGVETTFARILGIDTMNVDLTSEVAVGLGNIDIALALDTTGSMTGSKLADLKDAAELLVRTTYDMPNGRDRVRFAVVPFAQYVNVGMTYRNENWMNVEADGSYYDAGACWDDYPILSRTNCRPSTCYWSNDGTPTPYACEQCDIVYGSPIRRCGANVTKTWNGCVGSRAYPLNTQVEATSSTRIPGIMNATCAAPLMRLTNHESHVRNAIRDMSAQGETYIADGLMWGWRVVTHKAPFADGRPHTGTNSSRKIVVLMTDGANTRSPQYPDHEGWDATQANTLTTEVCTKMKAEGIDIYTIAFDVTDNGIKDILRGCISENGRFFEASNRSALTDAFQQIARSLQTIRLTK